MKQSGRSLPAGRSTGEGGGSWEDAAVYRLAALALLVSLLVSLAALAAPPRLEVEAPESLAPVAARVRAVDPERLAVAARLVGLEDPGPPIRVVLAREGSDLARGVPPWVAGYAWAEPGVVVLLPARSPSYPDASFSDLLAHEVAHVLIGRASGHRPLPRWFHEGLAMVAGGSWGLDDRSRLTLTLLLGDPPPLADLDRRFQGGTGEVRRAYAVSAAFVRDLVERHGPGVVPAILGGVRSGLPFEAAFARATGTPLAAAEADFLERGTFWNRWVPVVTSSAVLWAAITGLAVVAFKRRRERDAALARRWEEEEQRRTAVATERLPASAPPSPGGREGDGRGGPGG